MVTGNIGRTRLCTTLVAFILATSLASHRASADDDEASVGRRLQARELKSGTFYVFSVLHDPLEGLVQIFAEVHPVEVCSTASSCTFTVNGATKETLTVAATFLVPFTNLSSRPQLRECFVKCELPQQGLKLDEVTLEDSNGQVLTTWAVEEVDALPKGKKKGVGMCVGPVFSSTPTTLDWLQYYSDLGVSGINMYAVIADFVLKSGYMHEPGSFKAVQFEHHHLIKWRAFHPSKWSAHYYGQWLIYNDCVFRTRNVYEYILFHDRDEFVNFVGLKPKRVDLLSVLGRHFQERDVAGVTYWGALYHAHCHMAQAGMVGSRRARQGEDIEVQMYSGYDAWEEDSRKPNFTGCDWKTCHPKSVVRPLGVAVMNIHHFDQAAPGFSQERKMVSPEALFTKHVRCLLKPSSSAWEPDISKPLCSDEEVLNPSPHFGGVPVCPAGVVNEVRARSEAGLEDGP